MFIFIYPSASQHPPPCLYEEGCLDSGPNKIRIFFESLDLKHGIDDVAKDLKRWLRVQVSFAVLGFLLAEFTKYLSEVFLW